MFDYFSATFVPQVRLSVLIHAALESLVGIHPMFFRDRVDHHNLSIFVVPGHIAIEISLYPVPMFIVEGLLPIFILLHPEPIFIVASDHPSDWILAHFVPIFIIAFDAAIRFVDDHSMASFVKQVDIAEVILLDLETMFIDLLELSLFVLPPDVAIFWVVKLLMAVFVLAHVFAFLFVEHQHLAVLSFLQQIPIRCVFLVFASLWVNLYNVAILVYFLEFSCLGILHHFIPMLILVPNIAISIFDNLISSRIVTLPIRPHNQPIRIVADMLPIFIGLHFIPILVIFMMVALLIDFYSVAMFVIFYGVVVFVVYHPVAMVIELLRLPLLGIFHHLLL